MRRLGLNSSDLKLLVAFLLVVTITVSASTFLELSASPLPTDQFFSMFVLGQNGLTGSYFPDNKTSVTVGEEINWTIGVDNHMSPLQYVVVRVKLLNSTNLQPNQQVSLPSALPVIFEFAKVITDNETWLIPFTWHMENVTATPSGVQITGLVIDGTFLSGDLAVASSGLNFRFVFELWFYDQNTDNLAFSWATPSATYSVWNQLWFNATAT